MPASQCQSRSVFLAAGEASGDWVGGLLARALQQRLPGVELRGVGGRCMAAAGVQILVDTSELGAIGVFEAIGKLPMAFAGLRTARSRLTAVQPSAAVFIDCGAFNIPLARRAQRLDVPAVYYFPPGSWSRRPRSTEVRDLVDVIATPFAWSRDLLAGGRARVEWVGHPVVEAAQPQISREAACSHYVIDPARPVVALAPGSRSQEMRYLLPALAQAAALLLRRSPGLQFLIPVAPTVARAPVERALRHARVPAVLLDGMDYDALQLAHAAAVCSGTATLEFTCLRVPMVVVYRASGMTTLQYRLIRGLLGGQRFAAMPNILADRQVVPELLGSKASPKAIAAEVEGLLSDDARRKQAQEQLQQVAASLGTPGASDRTAQLVLELIRSREGVRELVS